MLLQRYEEDAYNYAQAAERILIAVAVSSIDTSSCEHTITSYASSFTEFVDAV